MVVDGIFAQGGLDLVGQGPAFRGLGGLPVDFLQDLGGLAQGSDCEEVGGHEELEDRGVVGGTEGGGDQAHRLDRVAQAVAGLGVELAVGHAREAVGAVSFLALLLLEHAQDVVHRGGPGRVEDAGVARLLPVGVGEADGIALRVDLPLALVVVGVHLRVVGLPLAAGGADVEGVGVRVDGQAEELAADGALQHLAYELVFAGQAQVGPHLGTAVAQPHGVDVTRIDEGVGMPVLIGFREMDGGVQGVGEAVGEHPAQARVGQQALDFGDLGLDGRSREEPVLRGGAMVHIGLGLVGAVP